MYLLIPVELCSYAITNKFIRPFQLYVYLKSVSSGKIKINKQDLKDIANILGLESERTIKNNLKILLKHNWIGYNKKSGFYFIRGFEKLRTYYTFKSRTSAEFDTKDIKKFKSFLGAAVIGYLVNQQRRREWMSERKKGRSMHLIHKPSVYYPVANLALAKILNISISTAFEFKKLAAKSGYILLKKNFKEIGVNVKFKKLYKRSFPELAHKVRVYKKKLMFQDIDTVLPVVRFKRRKKIETYIKGV